MKKEWSPIFDRNCELDRYFLRIAYFFAKENSDDPRTHVGAVIVSPNKKEILSYGANHLPHGIKKDLEMLRDREWKYNHMVHAEPAAIFNAAKDGKKLEGV